MDVSETLKMAWAAVQEADLPVEMHETAFREAVRLLASASDGTAGKLWMARPPDSASSDVSRSSGSSNGDDAPRVTEDEMYERVVQHTGIDRGKLERIVHLDDDPRVSLPGIKLGRNNAERARAVAQILAIARGFGLGESETPLEFIRAECDRLKVYDSGNFSSHMKALDGYIVAGSGQGRRLRVKAAGIASFPKFVNDLLGLSDD
jgi:hypothetical protein